MPDAITGNATASDSATAADVVIELPAAAGKYWLIPGLIYSYSGDPSAVGGIIITDGIFTIEWDEVAAGSFQRAFSPFLRGGLSNALTITLKSGGAGVTGRLNIVPAPFQQG